MERTNKKKAVIRNNILLMLGIVGVMGLGKSNELFGMKQIYAAKQEIQYQYDALGRVTRVDYQDDTYIEFVYDKNGNITDMIKGKHTDEESDSNGGVNTGGNNGSTDNGTNSGGDNGVTSGDTATDNTNEGIQKGEEQGGTAIRSSAKDVKQYNLFKKKKPQIKSLKKKKSKKKYYLTIQINQVKKRGIYGEIGYQIKYATNSKFKKAKTTTVTRHKKKKYTTKKWKVKKNKTYYVKVRAYMKTKEGKKIYTKYSKVKKIKVK